MRYFLIILFIFFLVFSSQGFAEAPPQVCISPGIFYTSAITSFYRNSSKLMMRNILNGSSFIDAIGASISTTLEIQTAMKTLFEEVFAEDISDPQSRMCVLNPKVQVSVGGQECDCELVSGADFIRNAKSYGNRQPGFLPLAMIGNTPAMASDTTRGDWYYLVVNKNSSFVKELFPEPWQDSALALKNMDLRLIWHSYMTNSGVKALWTGVASKPFEIDFSSLNSYRTHIEALNRVARQNSPTNPPIPLSQKLVAAVVSDYELRHYREVRGPVYDNNLIAYYLPVQLPSVLVCSTESPIQFTPRPFFTADGRMSSISLVGKEVGLGFWDTYRADIFFPNQ